MEQYATAGNIEELQSLIKTLLLYDLNCLNNHSGTVNNQSIDLYVGSSQLERKYPLESQIDGSYQLTYHIDNTTYG